MTEVMLADFISKSKPGLRESLRDSFTSVKLGKGEYLFFEGDPAENFYILESGVLEANAVHSDGKVYIFHFLVPGDIVGEGSLYGQSKYPFSVTARKESLLWKTRTSSLRENLNDNLPLMSHILELVGRKLGCAYTKMRCIAGERVEKRVACILMKLIDQDGINPECGEKLDTPLTNRDISGLIGSTEETVSRIMSRLKREGIIALENKQLVVKNKEALVSFFSSI